MRGHLSNTWTNLWGPELETSGGAIRRPIPRPRCSYDGIKHLKSRDRPKPGADSVFRSFANKEAWDLVAIVATYTRETIVCPSSQQPPIPLFTLYSSLSLSRGESHHCWEASKAWDWSFWCKKMARNFKPPFSSGLSKNLLFQEYG